MTPVDTLGEPVTVVDALGEPVVLINNDGTPAFLAYSAKTYLGGVAPYHWLDFINNRALYAGADVGDVTQATGYSFTRASDGYYTNADGTLTLFGSGALRRGDRGVLIEGARTNLCLRSQEFNSGWTLQNITIGTDAAVAPDGTTTADKLTEDSATGGHACFRSVTIAGSVAQAFSVFAKAAERSIIWIAAYDGDGATARVAWFDLATGAVGTVQAGATATIQALANGWYRCTIVRTNSSALTAGIIQIGVTTTDNVLSHAGTTGSGAFIWGAQVETASFPSSYIPTVAAAATRAADSLSYTAGVTYPCGLFAELERQGDTGAAEIIVQTDNGTDAQLIVLTIASTDQGRIQMAGGANAGSSFGNTVSVGVVTKLAGRGLLNDCRVAVAGTLGGVDTLADYPSAPTILRVGATAGATLFPFAYVRRIAVFNSALTDAQLQTTTS
jgi:hypothetical protein